MFRKLTVANLIDRSARKYGDKLFAVAEEPVESDYLPDGHDGVHFTCNDTLRITNIFAAAMREKLGVRAGDRIAVVLTNVPEIGTIFTAAARLGAVTVPFNFMLKAEELTRMVNDCGAKVMFTEPELFRQNIRDKANVPGIDHWIMVGGRDEVPEGFLSIDELAEGLTDEFVEPVDLDPDATTAIFYTSGTTGFPKGAMLTSRNLLSSVTKSVRMLRLGRKDFGIGVLPLAHIFGFNTMIVGGIYSGASGQLMRFFDPEKVLASIEKNRATLFLGVPAMYNFLLQFHPERYDLSSIRYWLSGADAMPVEHIKRFESFGGRFIEGYGLVETAPIVSVNLPVIRRPGSIGMPVPGVKVRIMGEDGNMLKRGEVGEIVVRGPNVMKGYYNDPERTREAFRYGWFHTGDVGYRDRIGFIYFSDREKDVIKAGGYSVFSREVEEEILENPKVLEVALVGEPHPTKGEVPVAFIQLKDGCEATEEELIAWSRERIAAYKAPRRIIILEEMPLTMTLKVMKKDLRKRLEDEQALKGETVPLKRKEE
ncbi:MAG: AMP-binding protein [Actinobacteria bacterium]|nr:AMP-binding protein [Actinomycetota bacterium]MCG2817843.1 AMP-binding protein [Actinomycetes bacterium]MBU4218042.1 AMP-binding protein [Actinomycetota bacterium]MBU4357765.1 AMP-binding protein [Actinomycetota bacterium]MBU4392361.1 AMP-binding protein [Actinomycetota bacterium]